MLQNHRTDSIIGRKITGWLAPHRTVLEIACSACNPALLGLGVFPDWQGKIVRLGKADTIFSKPRNSLSTPASDPGRSHRMRRRPVPLGRACLAPHRRSANDPAHSRVSHSRCRQIQNDIQRSGQIPGRRRISISLCSGVGLCLWAGKILHRLAVYKKAGVAGNQETCSRRFENCGCKVDVVTAASPENGVDSYIIRITSPFSPQHA